MVLTVAGATLLGGGLSALSNAFSQKLNYQSQMKANEQQQRFAMDMYERQRKDALEDWNRQNAYNSPAGQVQRYRAAGLNPQLLSGKFAEQGAMVRGSQALPYSPKAPQIDLSPLGSSMSSALSQYVGLNNIQAQTDNTKANTQVALQEAKNKQLEFLGMLLTNELKGLDVQQKKDLYDMVIQRFKVGLDQDIFNLNVKSPADVQVSYQQAASLANDIDMKKAANLRAEQLQPLMVQAAQQNLTKTAAEIANLYQQNAKTSVEIAYTNQMTQNAKNTDALQKLELYLKANGLDGNDPLYIKSVVKFLLTGSLQEAMGMIKSSDGKVNHPYGRPSYMHESDTIPPAWWPK